MQDTVVKKQWYLRALQHPQIEGYRYLQNVDTNFPSHKVSCPGKQKPQTSNTISYNTINLCLSKLIFLSHEALPKSFQQLRLPARFTCEYEGNTNLRNVWNHSPNRTALNDKSPTGRRNLERPRKWWKDQLHEWTCYTHKPSWTWRWREGKWVM